MQGLLARLADAALASAQAQEVLCGPGADVPEDLDDDAARDCAAGVLKHKRAPGRPLRVAAEGVRERLLVVWADCCDVCRQAVLQMWRSGWEDCD